MSQTIVVVQQTITGNGTNLITAAVDVPTGFTRAGYNWAISSPVGGNTFGRAVVQGSDDGGATWRDLFGLGSQDGQTGNGAGAIGGLTLPGKVRAILNWNGGFVLSISITLQP